MPSPRSVALETALTFQHVDRVIDALRNMSGGGWQGHIQAVLYWLANAADIQHVKKGCETYERVGVNLLHNSYHTDRRLFRNPALPLSFW